MTHDASPARGAPLEELASREGMFISTRSFIDLSMRRRDLARPANGSSSLSA